MRKTTIIASMSAVGLALGGAVVTVPMTIAQDVDPVPPEAGVQDNPVPGNDVFVPPTDTAGEPAPSPEAAAPAPEGGAAAPAPEGAPAPEDTAPAPGGENANPAPVDAPAASTGEPAASAPTESEKPAEEGNSENAKPAGEGEQAQEPTAEQTTDKPIRLTVKDGAIVINEENLGKTPKVALPDSAKKGAIFTIDLPADKDGKLYVPRELVDVKATLSANYAKEDRTVGDFTVVDKDDSNSVTKGDQINFTLTEDSDKVQRWITGILDAVPVEDAPKVKEEQDKEAEAAKVSTAETPDSTATPDAAATEPATGSSAAPTTDTPDPATSAATPTEAAPVVSEASVANQPDAGATSPSNPATPPSDGAVQPSVPNVTPYSVGGEAVEREDEDAQVDPKAGEDAKAGDEKKEQSLVDLAKENNLTIDIHVQAKKLKDSQGECVEEKPVNGLMGFNNPETKAPEKSVELSITAKKVCKTDAPEAGKEENKPGDKTDGKKQDDQAADASGNGSNNAADNSNSKDGKEGNVTSTAPRSDANSIVIKPDSANPKESTAASTSNGKAGGAPNAESTTATATNSGKTTTTVKSTVINSAGSKTTVKAGAAGTTTTTVNGTARTVTTTGKALSPRSPRVVITAIPSGPLKLADGSAAYVD